MESILTSVKKDLGIEEEDQSFDVDILMHINSALMRLMTLGIGPATGFVVRDATAKWTDLIGSRLDLEGVVQYVYLKTRMLFDPPTSSFVLEAMQRQVTELESILNMIAETTIGGTS